ncbi:MAG: hypothetical protein ACOYMN_03530 [Roseimicrobium sp.]
MKTRPRAIDDDEEEYDETLRPVKRQPYFWLGLVLAFSGLAVLLLGAWPLTAILWLVALVVDRSHFICPWCGNRLEKTSCLCAACGRKLRRR